MADLFRDRSCMHWWLPNDEGYPPIIRSIRKFVEERTSTAKNVPAEDLRDMKAIFASLKLDDGRPSIPLDLGKDVNPTGSVAVATPQDSYMDNDRTQNMTNMNHGERATYGLGYDDGHGYWPDGQGEYGVPNPE